MDKTISADNMVNIEPARPSDRNELVDLMAAIIPSTFQGIRGLPTDGRHLAIGTWNKLVGCDKDYSERYYNTEKDKDGFVVVPDEEAALAASSKKCQVARCNGKIIGFVEYERNGNIRLIGVAYDYRKQGLAKSLLSAAARDIHEHGKKWVKLRVWDLNHPSKRFFESLTNRNLMEFGESVSFIGHYTGFKGRAQRLDIWPTHNFSLPLPRNTAEKRPSPD